jgi:hypothetical protein
MEAAIMKKIIGLRRLLLAASLFLPGIGFAAEAPTGLEPKVEGGVAYVSGGVDTTQQQAIKEMRKDYNLQLLFALKGGAYLSDVKVKIQDSAGKSVLETVSSGPFLLARLPPGTYQVTADFHGKAQTRSAGVKSGGISDLNFFWDKE